MFNLFKQSSPVKTEDKPLTYPPIYPKFFSFSEPWTVQRDRLERRCSDRGSERAIRLYNNHRYKLENQWINPLHGINSGLSTANLSLYNYQTVDFLECSFLAQDPLMNNIFDILSTTTLSRGGKLKIINGSSIDDYNRNKDVDRSRSMDSNEQLIERIEQLALKFKIRETLEKAIRSCFIYGGCLLYLDYSLDNLEEPLDLNGIDRTKFKGFRPIDPILCSAVDVNTLEVGREDYMEPTKWSIVGLDVVHRSHLIKFEYNSHELILKPLCMYFGMSMTQLIKQDIANANLVSQGLANLVNKIRRTFIKMDRTSFSSDAIESIGDRLRLMQEVENNFTIFPIDYSEDIVQLTTSLQGFQEVIDAFYNLISSKTGMTINKLKGSSTGGLNANTGQAESDKNFIDKIETIRQSLIKDRLIKMYQIVASTMDNRLYNFDYEFNPLFNLSEREMAETINLNMDIATKLEQLGVKPEQCVSWLKSNKTNNMETLEMEEESNDSDFEQLLQSKR